jgi:septal ring factor EnvC (AmiA/AmiB activator)
MTSSPSRLPVFILAQVPNPKEAEGYLDVLVKVANSGTSLILLLGCIALGYLVYRMFRERDTIRDGFQKALEDKDKQIREAKDQAEKTIDEVKTEYAQSLRETIKDYVEELKLIREQLAESKVTVAQAKDLIERLERKLNNDT